MLLWLRMLSMLLPLRLRYEWLQEWHAELCVVQREAGLRTCLGFLKGAWADVFALREVTGVRWKFVCADVMSLPTLSVTALGLFIVMLSVSASREVFLAPVYAADGLVLLHNGHEKVQGADFADWTRRMTQLHVRSLAFYSVSIRRVNGVSMRVAEATPNLAQVLGLDSRVFAHSEVTLSGTAAKRFGTGVFTEIGGVKHAVVDALPATTLRLPGEPEVFLFVDHVPAGSYGYVVAENKSPYSEIRQSVTLERARKESTVSFEPLGTRTLTPWRSFWFALILTLLALPASQPLSRRNASLEHGTLPSGLRARGIAFLSSQMAMVVASSAFGALILATVVHCASPTNQNFLQAGLTFSFALPLLRLVLHSHRYRCPHCLKQMGSAAQVGSPSTSFLDWYGTELVCSQGHGLVHVPDMPTTWFPAPRWIAMDASWAGLFE